MELLLELLKQLEEDDTIIPTDECITVCHPILDQIRDQAVLVLISSNGVCNWKNIDILKANGYGVFALERDSFGWLIGGISTSKGIVAYG